MTIRILLVGVYFNLLIFPASVLALTITQPEEGEIYHPGDTVQVLAEAGEGEVFVPGVILDAASIDGGLDVLAPYDFEFQIPTNFLGSLRISAAGKTSAGNILKDEIHIQVVLPSSVRLRSILVDSSPVILLLEPEHSRTKTLTVSGRFSDGVEREVTTFPGTTFQSSNEEIVTVDGNGLMQAVGAGDAEITVRNGELKAVRDVIVKQKSRFR